MTPDPDQVAPRSESSEEQAKPEEVLAVEAAHAAAEMRRTARLLSEERDRAGRMTADGYDLDEAVRGNEWIAALIERQATALARLVRERDELREEHGYYGDASRQNCIDAVDKLRSERDAALARLDSARALLERIRQYIDWERTPADQEVLGRIDSWLASGGKTT